jgi:phosphoglycolate phosphatase/AHBA synthesis associated protein
MTRETKNHIQGLVFDLDGTLIDSLAITIDAFNRGIEHFGYPKKSSQDILAYFGPGEGEIFAKIVGPDNAKVAYQVARKHMDANVGKIPLHEGVKELLEGLKKMNLPVSIFTGRGQETTTMILNHHGIYNDFEIVITSDHVDQPKPSPEGLHKCLDKMKMKPEDVLFIGDSPVDMQAAKASGAIGVAALWDLMVQRELMEPWNPIHFAEKPKSIWEILNR